MKTIKQLLFVFAFVALVFSCKNESKEASTNSTEPQTENESTERTGQAFIEGDVAKPNVLQIAIGSPDHTTLVAAVQAAQLENALVNAGPLMVFAPTNEAFAALPEGTVQNLLKPENKEALANPESLREYSSLPF